jgi:GAF domain-containing protein
VIPYEEPSDLLLATFASPSGTAVENGIYTDEFGSVISAYVPIYKQDGSLESILAIDMSADTVIKAEQNAMQKILIYFGLSIPLITLLAWFLGYRLSRQTVALTTVAARIAHIAEGNFEIIPVSSAGNNKEAFDLIQIFNKMSGELHNLIENLEQHITERTADFEIASRNNERRAKQLKAISQAVRVISSIQDLDTLLPQITNVICEQFDVYHTGIFLLDDKREFAILRAANSEGGKKMLTREHKLAVGQTGIVGFVTASGQPRIASDVGTDAVFFDNPDLPNTHSEIALPLRYAGQIIGALDVQSTKSNAFNQDDIEILITLADQVATAIKNTLAFEEARNTVAKFQNSLNEKTYESWKVMQSKSSLGLGFQLIGSTIKPLNTPLEGEHIHQALAQNKAVLSDEENVSSSLAIPIRLRGQTVGIINLRTNNNYKLTNDDAEIAEAVTERLSLAIETATLLQATQHRADIERLTTDISSKISSSTRFETILQTAAQELSKALGGSDVLVQIEPISIELSMAK